MRSPLRRPPCLDRSDCIVTSHRGVRGAERAHGHRASWARRQSRGPGAHRLGQRGLTLIEVLVTVALIGVLTAGLFLGSGALASARLKRSASLVASAIRVAYNHANATSRPTRLVFDFDARTITLEEGAGRMLIRQGERSGGAMGATEAEEEAIAAAAEIVEGPKAPRASFRAVQPGADRTGAGGDSSGAEEPGKTLSRGIHFRQIEVAHEDDPVESERAYLYFWPGGQTERAAIQLMRGSDRDETDDSDVITLMVAPLTGKVEILGGALEMPRPMTDEEASEREDDGF